MLTVTLHDKLPAAPRFVVIAAHCQEGWLFCRHRERDTYELPGGHIEPGETPLAAAKRELYEETGALEYEIEPLCGYSVQNTETGERSFGVLCLGEIARPGTPPQEFEMAEALPFRTPPARLTYPLIQPRLLAWAQEVLRKKGGATRPSP